MTLKQKAEEILGRKITDDEGIKISDVESIEKKLKITFPPALKEFYVILGNIKIFSQGFQRFLSLKKLSVNSNKLLFLEENQQVVFWSVDLDDNATVYQKQSLFKKLDWYKEDFNISEFIEMLLYFQCVMSDEDYHEVSDSGFKYFASLNIERYKNNEITKAYLTTLEPKFQKVVNQKGLSIFWNRDTIILFILDDNEVDTILTCSKDENYFDLLIEKYEFYEL